MSARDSRNGTERHERADVIEIRRKLAEHDEQFRNVDRLEGRYLSTDAAVTAIVNAIKEHRAETRAQYLATKKQLARAQAMPLAVLAFLMCQVNDVPAGASMGTALVVCVVSFLFPELAARKAKEVQSKVRESLGVGDGGAASHPPPKNETPGDAE